MQVKLQLLVQELRPFILLGFQSGLRSLEDLHLLLSAGSHWHSRQKASPGFPQLLLQLLLPCGPNPHPLAGPPPSPLKIRAAQLSSSARVTGQKYYSSSLLSHSSGSSLSCVALYSLNSGSRASSTGFATVEPATLDVPFALGQEKAQLHHEAHQETLRVRILR